MAITEGQRHHLFQRLEEVLGTEEATTLMEHLPPVGWADVATKADLDHQRALTKADLDGARTDLKGDIDQLRGELDLKLEATIGRGLREQTRTLLIANLGYVTAFGSFVLAAAKL